MEQNPTSKLPESLSAVESPFTGVATSSQNSEQQRPVATPFNPEKHPWESWGQPLQPGYYPRRSRI